jgi:precorrin-6Y C5,15-methyltransferase (decarboxylating)
MSRVFIVGVGVSADTITAEGLRAVERADALIGAPRLLALFERFGKPSFAGYAPEETADFIRKRGNANFCVLVSGDTGFYSAAEKLRDALKDSSLTLIPGVSSLSYFFARLKRPWQDAAIVSCHGRKANIADAARRNRLTFALTGGNTAELGKQLTNAGFGGLTAYVGENLGSPEERLLTLSVSDLHGAGIGALAVLLVENPAADRRARFGIPDAEFIRGKAPMTKAETRAVTMSKLALAPDAACCDVGAGTGSVSVEMALAAYKGEVYAIDKSEEALSLVSANSRAFHIGNIIPVLGEAPGVLRKLPRLDAAFIGGSSGKLSEIFDALFINNPSIRVVVNAITLETALDAIKAFETRGAEADVIQLGVARARQVGNAHMLQAGSPAFIIGGSGRE